LITVTEAKPFEEILEQLKSCRKIYLVGCGSCAAMLHTGGRAEVLAMKEQLEAAGKEVTGWVVIPTTCDIMTGDAIRQNWGAVSDADGVLVLTCAYGVQTVTHHTEGSVYPALNTMFLGKESDPGVYEDVCMQCGNCVLGVTAGICPLTRCAKSLLNGPCGGSVDGKCEVSLETPCAWQQIIDRLAACGRLDEYELITPPRDWSTSRCGGPRRLTAHG
jgi:hypothetical protein